MLLPSLDGKTRLFLFGVIALGTILRLWLWSYPIEKLISWVIADDGFYYFKIAQNIAGGAGSTFDGVHITNGYHPLWMALNVVGFWLFDEPLKSIRLMLLVSVILEIATGLTLTYLGYQLFESRIYSLTIAMLWFLNHQVIVRMQNGMETSLSTLMIALTMLAVFQLLKQNTRRHQVVFGAIAGLAVLARTDNAVLIPLLFLAILLVHKNLRALLLPTTVIFLVTLPWFAWNYHHFQTVIQSSATAVTALVRLNLEFWYGSPLPFTSLVRHVATLWLETARRLHIFTGLPFGRQWAVLTVLWLLGTVLLLARKRNQKVIWSYVTPTPIKWLFAVLVLWPFFFISVHVILRWYFRPHYYASLVISVILILSFFIWMLVQNGALETLWAYLFVPLFAFSAYQITQSDLLRHQTAMYQAAQWLNTHHPRCTTVGAFNAGILGFFYEDGRVINLDGVVNNSANEAIQRQQLGSFAQRVNLCLLADFEAAPGELLRRPGWGDLYPTGSEVLIRFPGYRPTSFPYYTIYLVSWSNE